MKERKMYKVDLETTFSEKIFFILSIIIISLGYVTTPILVRSVVDGFIAVKDINSIKFSLGILILLEFGNILMNYYFNKHSDEIVYKKIVTNKEKILSNIKKSNDNNDIKLIFTQQLEFILKNKIKFSWMRLKDIFVLFLLSLVSMFISYQAGILILSVVILFILIAYILNFVGRSNHKKLKEYEKIEDKFLSTLGREVFDYKKAIKAIKIKELAKLKKNRIQSFSYDLQNSLRMIILLGVVVLGAKLVIDNTWEMGVIWALLVVAFRIAGPARGIATWVIEYNNTQSQIKKIEKQISKCL